LSGLKSYLGSLDPHPLAAIVWLLLTVSWFRSRRAVAPVTCSRVGLLLIFSGVGLLVMFWFAATYRLLLHVMPTLGLVACWWVSRRTEQAGTAVKRYWPAALLALFMLWGVVRIGHNLSWRGNTRVEFPTATFWTTPEDAVWLQQVVATVHERHPPGSSCFILGRGGLLLVGALMDIFSAIIVVVPLIAPMGLAFGVDPVHFGIIFLVNLELGYLTPPVGMNLFLASYRFNQPVPKVYLSVLPYLAILAIGVLIITYVPAITLTIPALFGR
ncbi:MAG: TRAP transporter large permease subunit, partial [Candidatus Marinimicrobia bacterium]|nr:TRAP transporter large permease subunit [Candidatus Neomarinimicrobiota bacterium]